MPCQDSAEQFSPAQFGCLNLSHWVDVTTHETAKAPATDASRTRTRRRHQIAIKLSESGSSSPSTPRISAALAPRAIAPGLSQ